MAKKGLLTQVALGGLVGATSSKLEELREEAKNAREMRLMGFQQKFQREMQDDSQTFQRGLQDDSQTFQSGILDKELAYKTDETERDREFQMEKLDREQNLLAGRDAANNKAAMARTVALFNLERSSEELWRDPEGNRVNRAQFDKMTPEQRSKLVSLPVAEAKDLANAAIEADIQKRASNAKEFLKSEYAKNLSKEDKDLAVFTIQFPETAAALKKTGKEFPMEEYQKSFAMGYKAWNEGSISDEEKKSFLETVTQQTGVEPSADELALMYGTHVAQSGLPAELRSGSKGTEVEEGPTPQVNKEKILADVEAGKFPEEKLAVLKVTDPEFYTEVVSKMEEKKGALSGPTNMLPSEQQKYPWGRPGRGFYDAVMRWRDEVSQRGAGALSGRNR